MDEKLRQAKLNDLKTKKDKQLYRFVGGDNKCVATDILSEEFEGRSVQDYLNELNDLKAIVVDILNEYECQNTIYDRKTTRERILSLLIINPSKKYAEVLEDDEGYIATIKEIENKIVEFDKIPLNVDNGCYQAIDNKIVLDKVKVTNTILL